MRLSSTRKTPSAERPRTRILRVAWSGGVSAIRPSWGPEGARSPRDECGSWAHRRDKWTLQCSQAPRNMGRVLAAQRPQIVLRSLAPYVPCKFYFSRLASGPGIGACWPGLLLWTTSTRGSRSQGHRAGWDAKCFPQAWPLPLCWGTLAGRYPGRTLDTLACRPQGLCFSDSEAPPPAPPLPGAETEAQGGTTMYPGVTAAPGPGSGLALTWTCPVHLLDAMP